MPSLRNKKISLAAGQEYEFPLHGDAIRVVSANVPVYFKTKDGNLDFYLEKGEKANFAGVDFLNLVIYHLDAVAQNVIISIGKDADVGSALVSGSVTILSNAKPTGTFNNTAITVTNLSAQVLAANVMRKSLMIQNKSLTGNIWVFLSTIAGAATQLNGIRLAGGQMLQPDLTHTGFITIIGDIATNPDVLICEA